MVRKSPWIPPFQVPALEQGTYSWPEAPAIAEAGRSIRVRLEMSASARDLALFNLAIDSKLRASDLVRLKLEDVCSGRVVRDRGVVIQKKRTLL